MLRQFLRRRTIPRWLVKSLPEAATTLDLCLAADPVSWAQQAFNFSADPKQADILSCAAARVIVVTSRQVGKSTIAALRALYLALHHANSLILMIGPVAAQADEILGKATHFAAELGLPIRGDGINEKSLLLPNGSPAHSPTRRAPVPPPLLTSPPHHRR